MPPMVKTRGLKEIDTDKRVIKSNTTQILSYVCGIGWGKQRIKEQTLIAS